MSMSRGITSPLSRTVNVSATAEKGRSAVARIFTVLLFVFPSFALAATNAQPASADLGIPTWAKIALPASVARTAGTVSNAVISVAEALPDVAGRVVLTAAESAAFDEIVAGTATGAAAITCPAWCLIAGAALAGGAAGYGLYKLATLSGPGGCSGSACPNSDYTGGIVGSGVAPGNGPWSSLNTGFSCSASGNALSCNIGFGVATQTITVTAGMKAGAVTGTIYNSVNDTSRWVPYLQIGCVGGGSSTYVPSGGSFNASTCASSGGVAQAIASTNSGGGSTFGVIQLLPSSSSTGAAGPSAPTGWDPGRQLVETRVCKNTSGTPTTVTATGATYHESWGRAIATHAQCPTGTATDSVSLISHTLDGSAPDKTVSTVTRPATVPVGTTPAALTLVIVNPDGSTEPCEQSPSPCAYWYSSPTKNDTFECLQGAMVLALDECAGLSTRYDPQPGAADSRGCFDGMGISPLSWPKGLIISPLKCLFVPSSDAMARWRSQISDIANTGVIALPVTFFNFVTSVANAGSTAQDCPTEQTGTFDNGHSTVSKTSPIHWCDIIVNAGDETQNTTWGMILFTGSRIILLIYFAFLWYNRIGASSGQMAPV